MIHEGGVNTAVQHRQRKRYGGAEEDAQIARGRTRKSERKTSTQLLKGHTIPPAHKPLQPLAREAREEGSAAGSGGGASQGWFFGFGRQVRVGRDAIDVSGGVGLG